ncbi:peptidase M10 [Dyadobacter sp. 3J3]|uniref:peptidase M10 n=1 Tax=Dyadobacter sp. 3J3 TaxID=2606600 RepID=UPI0013568E7A|nr:peptidase M10 [Dyadobacter sp. 3J3]
MAAIVIPDVEKNQIEIISRLYLYGSQATLEIGNKIIDEINRMYNEPEVFVEFNGKQFNVLFSIGFKIISASEAMMRATVNFNYKNNFIRIEDENRITRSFMGYGIGDNVGHWLTSDNLGTSTTAAHEFGHSLGLDHPANLDFRGSDSPPPIMAPRGSLVNPQYQWEPTAKAGEFGGTMNPKYRKVTKEEVLLILKDLNFENKQNNYIGQLSNTLFDKTGNPSRWLA